MRVCGAEARRAPVKYGIPVRTAAAVGPRADVSYSDFFIALRLGGDALARCSSALMRARSIAMI